MQGNRVARSAFVTSCIVLASALTGCGGDGDSADDTNKKIVLADGGGTFGEAAAKAVYGPCGEELGIEVEVVPYDYSVGQIKDGVQGTQE